MGAVEVVALAALQVEMEAHVSLLARTGEAVITADSLVAERERRFIAPYTVAPPHTLLNQMVVVAQLGLYGEVLLG
jgi:hypothetical protein